MAEVYKRVNGMKIEKVIALTREAQDEVDNRALRGAIDAEGYLNSARKRTGTSKIEIEKGKVDSYVVLDDTRGLFAAMSIEYGHGEYEIEGDNGDPIVIPATPGLFPLHKAFPALSQRGRDIRRDIGGGDDFE